MALEYGVPQFELITPEMAKKMLEWNTENRTMKKSVVAAYASDIKAGKWSQNGASIVIDENGILRDGQHRLAAIIEADTPCVMLIVRGVPAGNAINFDIHCKRSVEDVIRLAGTEVPKRILTKSCVAIARFTLTKGSEETRKSSCTPSQIEAALLKHREGLEYITKWRYKAGLRDVGILSALLAAYESGYNKQTLEALIQVFNTGETKDERYFPVIRLRNCLLMERRGGGHGMQIRHYMLMQHCLRSVETSNSRATAWVSKKEYYKFKGVSA